MSTAQGAQCCCDCPDTICATLDIDAAAQEACGCTRACKVLLWDLIKQVWGGVIHCGTIEIGVEVYFKIVAGVKYKCLRSACLDLPEGYELCEVVYPASNCPSFTVTVTGAQIQACGGNSYCTGGTLTVYCEPRVDPHCKTCGVCVCECLCMTLVEGGDTSTKRVCWDARLPGWNTIFSNCDGHPIPVTLYLVADEYTKECKLLLDAPDIGYNMTDITLSTDDHHPLLTCPTINGELHSTKVSDGSPVTLSFQCATCNCPCTPCLCPDPSEVCTLYGTVTATGCDTVDCPLFTSVVTMPWQGTQHVWEGAADPPPHCSTRPEILTLQVECISINGKPTPLLTIVYHDFTQQTLLPDIGGQKCDPVEITYTSGPFFVCGFFGTEKRILKITISE